jgi:phosphate transport system substrate-binding protein
VKKLLPRKCASPWRRLGRASGAWLIGLLMAGCSGEKKPAAPAAAAEAKVVIKGSNTIGEELLPTLVADYKKEHPMVAFAVEAKATGYGFWALLAGQCDIAGASRVAAADELAQAQARGIELNDHVIGAYAVAVVVNAGCPVENLSREQVRDIFTGVVQNWKAVGGPDTPIHLYVRDPISGTSLGFRDLAMDNKPYAAENKLLASYAAIVQAVAQDASGIGYSSLDLAKQTGVKPVAVGGVVPSAATVNQNQYPFARVLHLYTNKAKAPAPAREFIQFVQSPRGQEVVAQSGFVPKP